MQVILHSHVLVERLHLTRRRLRHIDGVLPHLVILVPSILHASLLVCTDKQIVAFLATSRVSRPHGIYIREYTQVVYIHCLIFQLSFLRAIFLSALSALSA